MNPLVGKTDYEVLTDRKVAASFQMYLEEAKKKVSDTISQRGMTYDEDQCIVPRMAFGIVSWVQNIYTCANRLVAICVGALAGHVQPSDEKVIDLLVDSAGYSLMAIAWMLMKLAEEKKKAQ